MKIAIVGECMFETLQAGDHRTGPQMPFGGDTVNTAVYLARLLLDRDVGIYYITRLGDSRQDDDLVNGLTAEAINCSLIERVRGGKTGSYQIRIAPDGERSFVYDRSESPARGLFSEDNNSLPHQLAAFDVLYVTGITLAILSQAARHRLLLLMHDMNVAGKTVVYDSNHRPALWQDEKTAQDIHNAAFRACTIALPPCEDLRLVLGQRSPENFLAYFREMAVLQTVLKDGDRAVLVQTGSDVQRFDLQKIENPRDTTGAGDSFNAGFLAARLGGDTLSHAVRNGHRLACRVIMHAGAIISKSDMGL